MEHRDRTERVMARQDRWVRRFHRTEQPSVRLVCFPHAGGGAGFYHPLSARLAGEAEVLSVQYPGRQDRRAEAPLEALAPLADQACEALLPWLTGEFAFFGHSMGAVVAFEVACRLQRRGGPAPQRLFASGRIAPSATRGERVHGRDDARLIRDVVELSGTDAELLADPEVRALILPALRADYQAIETYRFEDGSGPLTVPVTALLGDRDPRVTPGEARRWAEHTTAAFDLEVFPGGDHFYLAAYPEETAEAVRRRLSAGPR